MQELIAVDSTTDILDHSSAAARFASTHLVSQLIDSRSECHQMLDPLAGGARLEDSIDDLIRLHPDTVCEDRRDKVYALLSLRPSIAARIRPDYSISLLELFVQLCGDTFQHCNSYGVISTLVRHLRFDYKELHEVIETFLDADSVASRKFTDEERMEILHQTIDEVFLSRVQDDVTDSDSNIVSLDALRAKATEVQDYLEREGWLRRVVYKGSGTGKEVTRIIWSESRKAEFSGSSLVQQ